MHARSTVREEVAMAMALSHPPPRGIAAAEARGARAAREVASSRLRWRVFAARHENAST